MLFPSVSRIPQHGAANGYKVGVLFKRLLKREIEASVEAKLGKQFRYRIGRSSKVCQEWKQLLGHVFFFFYFYCFLSLFKLFFLCWFLIIPIRVVLVWYCLFIACFLFSLLPSAARMGDNRRTQVCFFTRFPDL